MDPDIDRFGTHLLDALGDGIGGRSGDDDAAATKLRALDDLGLLADLRPGIDYGALGFEYTVVFRIVVRDGDHGAVVERLQDTGRMVGIYQVADDVDVVAIGKFASLREVRTHLGVLRASEHVDSISTQIVLETVCEYEIPSDTIDGRG